MGKSLAFPEIAIQSRTHEAIPGRVMVAPAPALQGRRYREVIPQLRPRTPPPCLLLISGHRGGAFELGPFVLAAFPPPRSPLPPGRSRRAPPACYANHKSTLFDVGRMFDIDLTPVISGRKHRASLNELSRILIHFFDGTA